MIVGVYVYAGVLCAWLVVIHSYSVSSLDRTGRFRGEAADMGPAQVRGPAQGWGGNAPRAGRYLIRWIIIAAASRLSVVEWLSVLYCDTVSMSTRFIRRDSRTCAVSVRWPALNPEIRWQLQQSLNPDTEHQLIPWSLSSPFPRQTPCPGKKNDEKKKPVTRNDATIWTSNQPTRPPSNYRRQPPQSSADAQRQCGPFRASGRGDFAGWGTTSPRRQQLAATRSPEATAGGAPWTDSAASKAVLAPACDFSRVLAKLAIPSLPSSFFCFLPPSSAMLCYAVLCCCLALPAAFDQNRAPNGIGRSGLPEPSSNAVASVPRLSLFFPCPVSPAS